MASNGESSRQGHTYGPTTVHDSYFHQGDNIYLNNETRKVDCRDALLLKDPFTYRESLKNDKGERASGTCKWIRENETYKSWLDGDENCLWICGGPGKGKTMLSIFLTEELEGKQLPGEHNQDTTLLFFFCTNGNENYNNAIAVLRGLAYQLLTRHPDISTSVSSYFETAKLTENTLSSPEALWMVFKTLLRSPKLGTVYCILDGLDECDGKSIGILVKQFRDFYLPSDHTQNLKLAIVSRKINGLEDFPKIRLDPDNDNLIKEDIRRFISFAMKELSRRPVYDGDFLRDVKKILLRRSNGTFLWIGFVMKELLEMSTRMEAMEVLNALPRGLPAMYGRMLRQIKSSQRHIISSILKCVTIARRPMTLKELKTAVSLLCNTPIDSTSIMRDRIASCGPILQISSGEQDACTCSLVHQSARDYLLREEVDNDPILEEFRIKGKEAHASLARICFACIENSDLRHEPLNIRDASVLKKSPLLGYAIKHWSEHARHADENLDFPKTFIRKKDDVWKHWWQAYGDALGLRSHLIRGSRPLHIAAYLGLNPLVQKMLQANARRISLMLRKYMYVDQTNEYGFTPLILAAGEGHHDVVQLLLANGADVNATAECCIFDSITALEAAAEGGHLSVVRLLLANGANLKLPGNDLALNKAVKRGNEATVRLLLANGADANIKDYLGETALYEATAGGYEAIVRLLLANGADAKVKNEALFQAALQGHEAIVQLLLENGAVNKDDAFNNALAAAAERGHEATVRLLLANGARIDIKYSKAFLWAARDGHERILQILLENGADVNARLWASWPMDFWYTALEMAALEGHTTTVQFLLANGARNISTKDPEKPSRTALEWAVKKGHEDIVQLLLTHGVSRTDLAEAAKLAMQERHRYAIKRMLKVAGKSY